MKRSFSLFALCMLAACASGTVQETLGLYREAPDEFRVVSRPPLSVPPDFTLRAPEPGAPPRSEVKPQDEASRLFLKGDEATADAEVELYEPEVDTALTPVSSGDVLTTGEASLLGRLGGDNIDPEIRDKLYSDKDTLKRQAANDPDATLLDRLVGATEDEVVVDPFGEAERIRTNLDEGKPVNEGEVPVITKEETTLDKIF